MVGEFVAVVTCKMVHLDALTEDLFQKSTSKHECQSAKIDRTGDGPFWNDTGQWAPGGVFDNPAILLHSIRRNTFQPLT